GLALGKAYSVTFDTNAFMSGAFASFGIMDSTAWVFSTINPTITVNSINENFDLACASNKLPTGWNRQNVQGSGQEWSCYMELGGSNAAMQMNGYMGGNNVNEDWLITPRVTLGGIGSTEGKITFRMQKNFSGTEPDVLISNDYDGTSAPNTATWASLNIPMSIADTGDYKTFSAPIGLTGSLAFFIAFRYASTSTDGYRVRLDSVVLDVTTGVGNVTSKNNKMPLQILKAQKGNIQIAFSANTSGKMHASISDMVGRQIFDANIQAIQGENSFTFSTQDFPSGMYLIKVGSSQEQGVARAFIQ
ncbi:MAG: choice-of-anchor J domain-containing protein, partial [Chitinophagaceae bacterium]